MENILKLNFNMESIFYQMPFHFYCTFIVKVFLLKNKKYIYIYLLNQEKCSTCKIMNNIKSYKNR